MPRSTTAATFECSECGWRSTKWVGRCGECQVWGSVAEARTSGRAAGAPGLGRVPLQAGTPRS
ncbi:MAG: DNA repair protein RadA, partial [Streptosporangiaceae bacterium]